MYRQVQLDIDNYKYTGLDRQKKIIVRQVLSITARQV